MNKIIVKQNQTDKKGTALLSGTKTYALLFADDQFTTADPQDNLQRRVFKLKKKKAKIFGMEIINTKI